MEALTALADPTRRKIVELLARGERPVGAIASRFEITGPAISQHLKVLREARLVRVRAEAQSRIYELDPAGFTQLDDWLRAIRQFWTTRLDALERELNREEPTRKAKRKP